MTETHTPEVLDLFCCSGGAGVGYARAGFRVTTAYRYVPVSGALPIR